MMIKMYHFQEMKIIYLISIKKLDKKIYTSYNTKKKKFYKLLPTKGISIDIRFFL